MDWDDEKGGDQYDENWIWVDGKMKVVSDAEFEAHEKRYFAQEECEKEERKKKRNGSLMMRRRRTVMRKRSCLLRM